MVSSLADSAKTSFFANIQFILKFKAVTLSEGDLCDWGGHELARHLMGWRVLALGQNCSEICTASYEYTVSSENVARDSSFWRVVISIIWGYSMGFPAKGAPKTSVFTALTHAAQFTDV